LFFFLFFRRTSLQNSIFNYYFILSCTWRGMAKKQFAPPVTNFSISCDPSLVKWLNEYAHKNRTSRSRVVRKALIDFRAEHQEAATDVHAPQMDPERRCVECNATVIRVAGVAPICVESSVHRQPDSPTRARQLLRADPTVIED